MKKKQQSINFLRVSGWLTWPFLFLAFVGTITVIGWIFG